MGGEPRPVSPARAVGAPTPRGTVERQRVLERQQREEVRAELRRLREEAADLESLQQEERERVEETVMTTQLRRSTSSAAGHGTGEDEWGLPPGISPPRSSPFHW